MEYLTLFTIGPVQSFIAASRKLQDLYAGSFLLSYLSKQTMLKARDIGAEILFPDPDQESAPNRFLMKVKAENPAALRGFCGKLEEHVRSEWIRVAKKVLSETRLEYSSAAAAQIESLLQAYYAADEYRGGEQFGECYINAIKRLGSAKILRGFAQLDEPYGRKCNLSYEYNALFYREKRNYLAADAQEVTERNVRDMDKYIQPGETLGAVAFVKRCLRFAALEGYNDRFPSVTNVFKMNDTYYDDRHELTEDDEKLGYYAMVMFDGDNMGMWYSKPDEKGVKPEDTEAFQKELSRAVSGFAGVGSRKTVDWKGKKNGVVIYAGGEDFLGALNIANVFSDLRELREMFGAIDLSAYAGRKNELAFSAGIVVAHVKTPLSAVLEMVRAAEHKAKARKGKDAFCLTIAKHSGDVTEFVRPFYHGGKSSLDTLGRLADVIVHEDLSVKFIYQLGEELKRIAETDDTALHRDIFMREAERLLNHSEFDSPEQRERVVQEVVGLLAEIAEDEEFNLTDSLAYLRAVAFIARQRRDA